MFEWLRNAFAAFGLFYCVVTFTPLVSWWTNILARPWYGSQGDVLIVLPGSHQGDVIGESSYLRALYAVRAYREGHYRRILIAGKESSQAIREFLVGQSVPAAIIEIETESDSTFTNVTGLEPIMRRELASQPSTRFVLVTSDYHVFRSIRIFRKRGLTVWPYPAPDALKRYGFYQKRWNAFLDLALETTKLAYYAWKGWA